jgi:hypothetical protein
VLRIRDPGWVKIRIRQKHPGSATLVKCSLFLGGAVAGGLLGEEAGGGPQPDGRRHRLGGRRHPRHPCGE